MPIFNVIILCIACFALGMITAIFLVDRAIRHNIRRGVIVVKGGDHAP